MDRDKASPSPSTLQESPGRPPHRTLLLVLVDCRKTPGQSGTERREGDEEHGDMISLNLQVKETPGTEEGKVTCSTTCLLTDHPTYIWYKNGQHLSWNILIKKKASISTSDTRDRRDTVENGQDLCLFLSREYL
eukprot:XP_013985960.1 PREDICTED: uncharacterized protein LOC106564400 isoform X2 [Salmo salar]